MMINKYIVLLFLPSFSANTIESSWPWGSYGLPKPMQGCPEGEVWKSGLRRHQTNYGCHSSQPCHLAGSTEINSKSLVQEFCIKVDQLSNNLYSFMPGKYCIFKKGPCPKNFKTGWIKWDDADNFFSDQIVHGDYPDGSFYFNTKIEYCCRDDGDPHKAIKLPTNQPFFLLQYGNFCQEVEGMKSSEEWLYWKDSQWINANDQAGFFPRMIRSSSNPSTVIYYCYYKPLAYDELSQKSYPREIFPPLNVGWEAVMRIGIVIAIIVFIAFVFAFILTITQKFKVQRKSTHNENNKHIRRPIATSSNLNDSTNASAHIPRDLNRNRVTPNRTIQRDIDDLSNETFTNLELPSYQEAREDVVWSHELPPSYHQAIIDKGSNPFVARV